MNWGFGLGSGSVPLGSAKTGSARAGLAQLVSAWAILTRHGKSASFRLCVASLPLTQHNLANQNFKRVLWGGVVGGGGWEGGESVQ